MKRLFSRSRRGVGSGVDWSEVADWSQRNGHVFKRAREAQGFVVDGASEGKPWRLEWGPSQRDYIVGMELRLRMELELAAELQLLLMSSALMVALERKTYEQFTEGTQTQSGAETPEEMRWLVMFPKVESAALSALRPHLDAVASAPAAGAAWIEGPLAAALERATAGWLKSDPPFLLMTLRNRCYLRAELAVPTAAVLEAALDVFVTGAAQAIRSAASHVDTHADWARAASSAWLSLRPDDAEGRKRR